MVSLVLEPHLDEPKHIELLLLFKEISQVGASIPRKHSLFEFKVNNREGLRDRVEQVFHALVIQLFNLH